MKPLEIEEKKLLDNWQSTLELKGFCKDGVADHEKWESTNPKVIFLLKETNGLLESLPEYLTNFSEKNMKNFGATWFNIARWSYGIQRLKMETKWAEFDGLSDKILAENLKYICAINIKKTPGGRSTKPSDINKALLDYGNKTFEQIQLYKAHFLILCGTGDYFNKMHANDDKLEKIKWDKTTRGIWYSKLFNGIHVIWYYHPGAHFPKQFLFYNLIDAIKELINV